MEIAPWHNVMEMPEHNENDVMIQYKLYYDLVKKMAWHTVMESVSWYNITEMT